MKSSQVLLTRLGWGAFGARRGPRRRPEADDERYCVRASALNRITLQQKNPGQEVPAGVLYLVPKTGLCRGQDDDLDPAVLGLAGFGQVRCDRLIFATAKGVDAPECHAALHENVRNRIGAAYRQVLIIGR